MTETDPHRNALVVRASSGRAVRLLIGDVCNRIDGKTSNPSDIARSVDILDDEVAFLLSWRTNTAENYRSIDELDPCRACVVVSRSGRRHQFISRSG